MICRRSGICYCNFIAGFMYCAGTSLACFCGVASLQSIVVWTPGVTRLELHSILKSLTVRATVATAQSYALECGVAYSCSLLASDGFMA
jgi:hypothetical protein